jgi:hypothetical protein
VESRHNGVTVPLLVRQKATAQGAAGQRWLRDLPSLLGELARDWDLTLGEVLAGGSESCVVAASTGQYRVRQRGGDAGRRRWLQLSAAAGA